MRLLYMCKSPQCSIDSSILFYIIHTFLQTILNLLSNKQAFRWFYPNINVKCIIARDLFGSSFSSRSVHIAFVLWCQKNASGNWCHHWRQFGFHLLFLCLRPACHLLAQPIVLRLQLHGLSFEMWLWNQQLPSDAPWKDGCQVTGKSLLFFQL